ncbi:uncharacterized protein N7458_003742 [Penicillium daleae]|uniref:Uncharacterized protein n=1 Tax=Penicillium daleae TaxID=63821 RepID=A0AAD6G4K4_9EURO|nr:uncharacterized protein N7458_003742 [Penicillium daleae]KAJ5456159.1 hypothetical protein N7458_003742 [Penicillium daleae]
MHKYQSPPRSRRPSPSTTVELKSSFVCAGPWAWAWVANCAAAASISPPRVLRPTSMPSRRDVDPTVPAVLGGTALRASKWDRVLAEVIENADILSVEHKLAPLLALLWVYDHLLSKKGIAAPAASRFVKRWSGIKNLLKAAVLKKREQMGHPISFIRLDYGRVDSLAALPLAEDDPTKRKLLYMDPNIPDLVADKASCFPAYLLLGDRGPKDAWQGDLVDGCAAPGNKTTHWHRYSPNGKSSKILRKQIFSMDASKGQDFLALDPMDSQFENVSVPQPRSGPGLPSPTGKRATAPGDHDEPEESSSNVTLGEPSAAPSDENDIPSGPIDNDRLLKVVESAGAHQSVVGDCYDATSSQRAYAGGSIVACVVIETWRPAWSRRRSESVAALSEEDLEACLRCWSGDAEGLGGFFVAGFVRDSEGVGTEPVKKSHDDHVADGNPEDDAADDSDEDEEWDGFSD